MAKRESTIHTPMGSDYGHAGASPSGKVCINGEMGGVQLPKRDVGPNSVPEVTLDENGGLPEYSKGKK